VSRLDLVVGPNGSGRSTFVRFTLAAQRPGFPFVNADILAARRWPDVAEAVRGVVDASVMTRAVRDQRLAGRREFIAETVASFISGEPQRLRRTSTGTSCRRRMTRRE
jgi:predicted ABC-type ATPase